uniref:Putative outer membrane protein A n=1 Tax=termite gut metagenome TaxID=433724 RepID=S0DGS0_9ZZZZ
MKKSIVLLAALFVTAAVGAQEPCKKACETGKRAWEVGLGGSVFQFNRVDFVSFTTTDEAHYVNMQLRHVAFGANIYAARELSNVFTVDFQGALGGADGKWLTQVGLGVQWRFGHYFHSKRIDPYLRIGGNYLYKGFDVLYGDSLNGMDWEMINELNKEGADSHHLFTVAAGLGINMWLNNRFGIGLQGDYLLIPKPNVANSLQGTIRFMYRIGK